MRVLTNRCNLRGAGLVAVCLLVLSGCGAKGPLYLPEDGEASASMAEGR